MILTYCVAAAFIMHGFAHLSGFAATFTKRDLGFTNKPWLFSPGVTLQSSIGKVFGIFWLVAAMALDGSRISLLARLRGLPGLPIGGALMSLLAIIPWWNTVVPGAKAGALFDLITLIALLPPWREQVMAYLGL